jgi:tetratricopeptide (TPR) repeat protein
MKMDSRGKFVFALLLTCAFWMLPSVGQSQTSTPSGQSPSSSSDTKQAYSTNDSTPSSSEAVQQPHAPNLEPPRSDRVQADDLGSAPGDSSSKDTEVDLAPPKDDAKAHPNSSSTVEEQEAGIKPGGISEFHTWDPHKAAKDIEVGNFYFKRGNYKAAEDRFREALTYKENDAVATFGLAQSLEKLGVLDDARAEYESYLKILPHGPEASQAQKALEKLKSQDAAGPR